MPRRKPRIAGLYLAAGSSRRMGRQKLLIRTAGDRRPIGTFALDEALQSGLDDLTIVSSSSLSPLWKSYCAAESNDGVCDRRLPIDLAELLPEETQQGLSRSIRRGMMAALREGADAVVILLADQPLVTAVMIDRLIGYFLADPGLHYVAWHNGEALMPPMLLSSSLFPAMLRLEGDKGARELLGQPGIRGRAIVAERPERLLDIDTAQDLIVLEHWLQTSAREERCEPHDKMGCSNDRHCQDIRDSCR